MMSIVCWILLKHLDKDGGIFKQIEPGILWAPDFATASNWSLKYIPQCDGSQKKWLQQYLSKIKKELAELFLKILFL